MRKLCCAAAVLCLTPAVTAPAAGTPPEAAAAETETVITRTAGREENRKEWLPFRVCVLDFTSPDIQGQKRFLDQKNQPIVVPPQCTLNDADRKSINGIMQGLVRMIDAWDNTKTNTANRVTQIDDNAFTRGKAVALYDTIVKGEARPMVVGAEYLAAYLGRHNDVFGCVDAEQVTAAMEKLRQTEDFPKDFMLQLARETGATHLICGVVSDLRSKTNSFKGYGIETETNVYQLDVVLKMVDLAAQRTVYGNVYTGSCREQRAGAGAQIDNNIFQTLMNSALEQAAEDLYDVCKPGRKNKVSVTPMPFAVTVNPAGGLFFKPAEAEIYMDGGLIGSGGVRVLVPAGRHAFEIKAAGYKTKTFDVDVTGDTVLNMKLEKE